MAGRRVVPVGCELGTLSNLIIALFLDQSHILSPRSSRRSCAARVAISLADYKEAIFLWRINKLDFLVWLAAFIIVVFAGVEIGLGTAVGLSLLIVLWKVPPPFQPHMNLRCREAPELAGGRCCTSPKCSWKSCTLLVPL